MKRTKKERQSSFENCRSFLEVPPGFEPGHNGFADRGLTTWLRYRIAEKNRFSAYKKWSGLRGSNSLPPPWQGGALPDELNPHGRICASGKPMRSCHCCDKTLTYSWCLRSESNQRHGDFQSPALPTELQRQIWRPGWGSNPRPLA